MHHKIVSFGEIMLRLSTPGLTRFIQTQDFNATYGGGEANVAVSLANYGLDSYFVTKLPKHEIGQSAVNHLRRFGINTDYIVRGGDRIGIYFLESGASQRPSKVIYDRAGSAIAGIQKGEIDWNLVFENANWFHWTGITPAISKEAREVLTEACTVANQMGVMVSCDLNFRAKMWTQKEAQSVMIPLMEYVDVCISNEEDADKSLGLKAGKTNVEKGQMDIDGYFLLAQTLKQKYDFASVAVTLRESCSASKNGWSAMMLDNQDCASTYLSHKYDIEIVDRVGGGDAFTAGLIYGMLNKPNSKDALEFAVAASCLKHSIHGDFNLVSIDEVENLINSGGSGRVER
ncbi:MAG: sugar kinase [Ignavibacteriaceae bacterium]|nr:sugar kinase [Ignavibacteriaceae bacterium]